MILLVRQLIPAKYILLYVVLDYGSFTQKARRYLSYIIFFTDYTNVHRQILGRYRLLCLLVILR